MKDLYYVQISFDTTYWGKSIYKFRLLTSEIGTHGMLNSFRLTLIRN